MTLLVRGLLKGDEHLARFECHFGVLRIVQFGEILQRGAELVGERWVLAEQQVDEHDHELILVGKVGMREDDVKHFLHVVFVELSQIAYALVVVGVLEKALDRQVFFEQILYDRFHVAFDAVAVALN